MRLVFLRNRLLFLAAAGILPLAAMAALALIALTFQQRAQAKRAGIETARALASAVDAELASSIAALKALAAVTPTDPVELLHYPDVLKRVLDTQPDWISVNLADPAGTPQLGTAEGSIRLLERVADKESFAEVVRSGHPVVGRIVSDAHGRYYVPVRVPVLRDGTLRFVLTAELRPDSIVELLERQRVPHGWVVSVFDSGGLRVARSRLHRRYLATPGTPSLVSLMEKGAPEGGGMTDALEGDTVYATYSRSQTTGWCVAIGIPLSVIGAGAVRSGVIFGGGLAFSLAVAAFAALSIARSITRPMTDLAEAARRVGRRQRPELPATPIREIQDVSDVLAAAAEEQSRHEAERDELLESANRARAVAEAANRAKDDFLAMLGHELRNPLGAIANARTVLENPRANAEALSHARSVIGRQVDHLSRLTDDLLDATRAMTGKIHLQRRPIDLGAAVAEAVGALRASDRPIRQRLVEKLDTLWVDADPTRIEQIVTNLIGNAMKYTQADGKIEISLRREGAEAVLRVADDGVGVSRDLAERIFEPFVQGDSSLDRSHGGLGLGLTLVRRLAELHGGSASVRSEGTNRGSEFVVRLPAIEPPRTETGAVSAASLVRPRDVLIVEDNVDERESLQKMLELEGHRVRVAGDADSALSTLHDSPPDVALIDIGLPVVDGYELARRIVAEVAADRRPRLVALTGYGMPEDRKRSRSAGFDAHMVKPVIPALLQRELRRADRSAGAPAAS